MSAKLQRFLQQRVAKTLSTITLAPALWASETAWMSMMSRPGLEAFLQRHTSRPFQRISLVQVRTVDDGGFHTVFRQISVGMWGHDPNSARLPTT